MYYCYHTLNAVICLEIDFLPPSETFKALNSERRIKLLLSALTTYLYVAYLLAGNFLSF